ncbi:hypothetical protein ACROYT_G011073 [Oculina patagonica]
MGFFDGNHTANAITGSVGKEGPAGVGFKLTESGDYDMDKKKIFGLKTQDDVAFDADLDTYAKDLSSAVNKRYVNQFLMKKNSDETHFDCVGLSLQNTEAYYDGLYNDLSIPNVEYVKLEDNKVKTELNNKLTDKADLSTNNEQTFNSIINVPKFDSGYSNMSNVMNKEYIDSRDALKADKSYTDNTYLTKNTGAILSNSIQSKASKVYVDSTFLTKSVGNGLAQSIQNRLNIHGSNMMQANLHMGGYNITHLKNPTNDTDAVNKKYMLDHVDSSHITSVGQENTFAHIMTDSINQLSEEDDIKLGSLIDHPNSYHKINTKVVDSKLVLDSNKGYYSSRLGINVYSLPINRYTMVFELFFPAEIDHDSLDIDIVSSIDNIDKSTTRVYDGYSRTIAQINKYQQHPNNYLYVDIVLKMKSGNAYVPKLQTYIVIYGIKGYQSNVDPRIYDQLYYVENDRIAFNASIDMKTKTIYGIKPATTNDQAVNYEQLKNFRDNLKSDLELKMDKKRNISYYHKIFEYFYDLTDPSEFIMSDSNGAVVSGLNGNLVFNPTKLLSDFDPKKGFMSGFEINLNENVTESDDWTIYMCFSSERVLNDHKENCIQVNGVQAIKMPDKDNNILKFNNFHKQQQVPFVIYADFEAITEKISSCKPNNDKSYTEAYQKHQDCGYGYKVVCCYDDQYSKPVQIYRGEKAVYKFMEKMLDEIKYCKKVMKKHFNKPLKMTKDNEENFKNAKACHICDKQYTDDDIRVRDHCHIIGKYRGSAHQECNLKLRIESDKIKIPVIFHNLRGYDSHFIMQEIGAIVKNHTYKNKKGEIKEMNINAIPNNMEKYMAFMLGNHLNFIDSFQFMSSSLEQLVSNLPRESLKYTSNMFKGKKLNLMTRKGVYPYDYMDSFNKFNEGLPTKEDFYSILNNEHISDKDYKHVRNVCKTFKLKTMGEYHDLYLQSDVLLLADVFENFRKTCFKYYGLDPCWYFSSPNLSWDAMLKMTGIKLELMTDIDMYQFIEKGMRGG